MELLKVLAMPFQLASLLFVAVTSLLLTIVTSVGPTALVLALPAICLLLVWLTQFAFTLIDDATNGVRETATASAEMLSPLGDPRCWVHPVLAVAIGTALLLRPEIPRLPVLIASCLLFPLSIGAIAMSGHARDALNPLALARVLKGLASHYLLAVLGVALFIGLGVLVANSQLWTILRIAMLELLVLLVYACVGGLIFMRRTELGFEPRVSPERKELRAEQERAHQRQQMIDGLYRDLRVREAARAVGNARQWLEQSGSHQLQDDMKAILDAGARWSEPRGFALLLRDLVPVLLTLRQPALAFAAVEAGIAAVPAFAPEQECDAVAIIRYALQTGRKRQAAALLTNFMNSAAIKATPGPELLELQERLHSVPTAP